MSRMPFSTFFSSLFCLSIPERADDLLPLVLVHWILVCEYSTTQVAVHLVYPSFSSPPSVPITLSWRLFEAGRVRCLKSLPRLPTLPFAAIPYSRHASRGSPVSPHPQASTSFLTNGPPLRGFTSLLVSPRPFSSLHPSARCLALTAAAPSLAFFPMAALSSEHHFP